MAMNTSSRVRALARVKAGDQHPVLNAARAKLCPHSPFWPPDVKGHKEDWEAGRARQALLAQRQSLVCYEHVVQSRLRQPFDGREFDTSHSAVLSCETMYCPQWHKGKINVAPWPSHAEMKYEGDDRISTDRLHGRFLCVPRVEGNETVIWQHRAMIKQFALDERYYPTPQAVEIFLRSHRVGDLEFSDEEGIEALGQDFFDTLDPKDQW